MFTFRAESYSKSLKVDDKLQHSQSHEFLPFSFMFPSNIFCFLSSLKQIIPDCVPALSYQGQEQIICHRGLNLKIWRLDEGIFIMLTLS